MPGKHSSQPLMSYASKAPAYAGGTTRRCGLRQTYSWPVRASAQETILAPTPGSTTRRTASLRSASARCPSTSVSSMPGIGVIVRVAPSRRRGGSGPRHLALALLLLPLALQAGPPLADADLRGEQRLRRVPEERPERD